MTPAARTGERPAGGWTLRFSARGDGVAYLGSIFLAASGRLLLLFRAESPETVQAVN